MNKLSEVAQISAISLDQSVALQSSELTMQRNSDDQKNPMPMWRKWVVRWYSGIRTESSQATMTNERGADYSISEVQKWKRYNQGGLESICKQHLQE